MLVSFLNRIIVIRIWIVRVRSPDITVVVARDNLCHLKVRNSDISSLSGLERRTSKDKVDNLLFIPEGIAGKEQGRRSKKTPIFLLLCYQSSCSDEKTTTKSAV